MSTHLAHLAHKPLAILPSSIDAFAMRFAEPALDASRFIGARAAGAPYRMYGDTAIIGVLNPLVGREGQGWGTTSFEYLTAAIQDAARNDKAKAIVLDVDSGGGHAVGMVEAAAVIRRVNSSKPVTASVNGLCCSAAYCLASAARSIVTTPSSTLGSVGIVALHADASRMVNAAGITPSFIYAGARKIDGNAMQPLSTEAREGLQREVDGFYQMLLTAVAAGRGYRLSEAAARATEAATFIGGAAVKAGFADTIGTFDEALTAARRAGVGATHHVVALPTVAALPKPQPKAEEGVPWDQVHADLARKLFPRRGR